MKSALKVGAALALGLLSALPAEAARTYCEAAVSERLDRLNVDSSDVRGIFYETQRQRTRVSDRVIGILAWVSLHSCKGSLIVDLSPQCRVRQVYGRGACDLGGAVETW